MCEVVKRLQTARGGIVEIRKLDTEDGTAKYDAVWIPDFSHVIQLLAYSTEIERTLGFLKGWDPKLQSIESLGDYRLFAKIKGGKVTAVSLRQGPWYKTPILAKEIPAGVKLTPIAQDFICFWKGDENFLNAASPSLAESLADTSFQPEKELEYSRVVARTILEAVATYHHLPVQELGSRTRRKRVADARHVAMYLLRMDSSLYLKEIGFLLGGRDHSTVIHGVQKILRSLNNNPKLLNKLGRIRDLATKTCTQTE